MSRWTLRQLAAGVDSPMAAPPRLPELFYRAGANVNHVLAGGLVTINLGRNTRNWTLPIRRAATQAHALSCKPGADWNDRC
jgi:hypothetical protein